MSGETIRSNLGGTWAAAVRARVEAGRQGPNYYGHFVVTSDVEIEVADPNKPVYFESLKIENDCTLTLRTWTSVVNVAGDMTVGSRASTKFLPPKDVVTKLGDLER